MEDIYSNEESNKRPIATRVYIKIGGINLKKSSTKLLLQYILWTFLITYCSWGILILASQMGRLELRTPLGMLLLTIGGSGPPLAAYFILRHYRKISGFKPFIKEAFAVKQPLMAYIIVFIFTTAYFGIPALLGGSTSNSPIYMAVLSIPIMIIGGGLEELGWRYILQPMLEKKIGFFRAVLVTSVIWAVWHIPLFFIKGTSQYNWNFGLFTLMVIGLSFALAVIYRLSKSIWLCILFHSLINAFSASWVMDERLFIKLVTTIGIITIALVLLFIQRGKAKHILDIMENTKKVMR
ncbi:hypothetical protein PAECIP112173_02389 [Paenibacillus sp. JJ-100]|nr:hypothetical protein PAECIP112173_02389 [Paenibacillus sp. JJ-100]